MHVGFLLQASGRWNRKGEYGCLYTSLSRAGAIAEYRKVLASTGLEPQEDRERDLTTILARVEPVLDLSNPKVMRRLGVGTDGLTGDEDADFEFCRRLADWARSEGYSAILSPSAAAAGERNLNVYFDVSPQKLQLELGSVREALNY